MKPASDYALMSDPELNRQFSRRWVECADFSDLPPAAPPTKTLDDLSAELLTDWRRYRQKTD
jgi:hypothetical protein